MSSVSSLAHRLATACQDRDETGLVELLDQHVVALSDGGGTLRSHQPIVGAATVASALLALAASSEATFRPVPLRGQTGLLISDPGGPIAVVGIAAPDRGVVSVWISQRAQALRRWDERDE